jgi:hypothetical protein
LKNLFQLFDELAAGRPDLFEEASKFSGEGALSAFNAFASPFAPAKERRLTLFGPQLREVQDRLLETVELGGTRLQYVSSPTFPVDAEGELLPNSGTVLGQQSFNRALQVATFRSDEGAEPNPMTGSYYLYSISVVDENPRADAASISAMDCGAQLFKTATNERVLVVKYDPNYMGQLTGLRGEELLDRLSANVGNNIANLIKKDEPETKRRLFIRLAEVPKPAVTEEVIEYTQEIKG